MDFVESEDQKDLRAAVAALGKRYGSAYGLEHGRSHTPMAELWAEAGKLGFIGVNLPEEHGGGGAGLYELAVVQEELAAAGCGLLMLVVSPAICGSILTRFGTEEQKRRWLPGIADGTGTMAFAITEPDAGSNSHAITTTARRVEDGWSLTGRKIYISGVDQSAAILVVGRTEDARTGRLKPALFVVPTDSPGLEFRPIEMDLVMSEQQFTVFLDDVRVPADALVGAEGAAMAQLFAGLNPERVMAAALAIGNGRHALDKATQYAKERSVFGVPIGAHQGISHPLAQAKVDVELARLMMQKGAALYDGGDDVGAAEAANMAKYAAGEAGARAVDQAVQTLGGNAFAAEYGLGALIATSRAARIVPVSREMILNFIAQTGMGLPKSY